MIAEQTHHWLRTVQTFTECLVSLPTISPDNTGEGACAEAIAHLLRDATDLAPQRWPTGDGRHSVACLLTGTHPANTGRTLILMGHYDTVGVTEFDTLTTSESEGLPFDPARLHTAFTRLLAEDTRPALDLVRDDLAACLPDGQPAWLFGRGALDMKSGMAAAIAVMRQLWTIRDTLAGNILFLACPDEEHESLGIRSALPRLLALRDQHRLTYLGVVNTDYVTDDVTTPAGQAENTHYVYAGTVGKLLVSFYIIGVPTHVGEPFRGVDANQIATALVQRINLNPQLSDRWTGNGQVETMLPPVTLRMRDLKAAYSVQTVQEALVCVNWLTCTQSPDGVLHQVRAEAQAALTTVLEQRAAHYRAFKGQPDAVPAPTYEPLALTFAELCDRVRAVKGWPLAGAPDDPLLALLDILAAGSEPLMTDFACPSHSPGSPPDLPERSRLMVQRLAREAGIQGPAVIVFFAPPYYPHLPPQDSALLNAVECQINRSDQPIRLRPFYPYISDMSFVSLAAQAQAGLPALTANMPLFGRGYTLDFDAMRALGCPVVNIGPWGRDAHGLFERVYKPYAFEVVPQLIYDVSRELLCHDA